MLGVSKRLGLALRVAHYPPLTHPSSTIEHGLFSQVERSLRGITVDSPRTALETVQRTSTTTGLEVTARIFDNAKETKAELGHVLSRVSRFLPPSEQEWPGCRY
jgi:hypothetical protein